MAMLAVQRADTVAAKAQYSALEYTRGTLFARIMSGDRLLGLLSQTLANLEQAMAHFDDGLAFCRKASYRPELAISRELGMRPLMVRVLSRRILGA